MNDTTGVEPLSPWAGPLNSQKFEELFVELTGRAPFPWQTRLFAEYFSQSRLPAAVDVPTGLGKTAVIALWLIAIRSGAKLPRRLVYVVDRRAVVDQATSFVEDLRRRLPADQRLPVSTLRGQHADNREWLDDPSAPAIIVGTVDMIGSRLLFQGYGVSRKMRPYQAGLLGADTLIVLDEAHLVPPFERLLESIEPGDGHFGAAQTTDQDLIPRLRLLSLSATGRKRQGDTFRLEEGDIHGESEAAKLAQQRLRAPKTLRVTDGNPNSMPEQLAERAWTLSDSGTRPLRYLVYCNSREHAEAVRNLLEKHSQQRRRDEDEHHAVVTELFIGARRGHEREAAEERLRTLGFLADSNQPEPSARFLIATSAGEVGVDLDADHMVCDLVAWDRMIQRLGRVNRRGHGNAVIEVIDAGPVIPKSASKEDKARLEIGHRKVRELFESLPAAGADGFDVSPGTLHAFKREADAERETALAEASSPVPLRPALTRALLDAWSMTTLRTHTGRPEVSPWLRGWVDEDPQTAIVWRAHLPVPKSLPRSREAERRWHREIEAYFEAAPPHISERLQTESYRAADWLLARVKTLARQAEAGRTNGVGSEADVTLADHPIAIVLTPAGDYSSHYTLRSLDAVKKDRLIRELAGNTLVIQHSIGGLTENGTLDARTNETPGWLGDNDQDWTDDARDSRTRAIGWRVVRVDGDEPHELEPGWRKRFEFARDHDVDGDVSSRLVVYKLHQDAANEEDRSVGRDQSLAEHQSWAAERARGIGERIGLPERWIALLVLAARLHDEGKRAERWQRAFNTPSDGRPYAKAAGPVNFQLLDGYRHEFGSLLYAEQDAEFQALDAEEKDLVLHLIAAHHGYSRPTISTRGCDLGPPSALQIRARDVALRFARLQRRWGPWGLAWWEALLRAADQQASKDNERRTV